MRYVWLWVAAAFMADRWGGLTAIAIVLGIELGAAYLAGFYEAWRAGRWTKH